LALTAIGANIAAGSERGAATTVASATRYTQPDLKLDDYDKVVIQQLRLEYDELSAYRDASEARQARICAAGMATLEEAVRGRFAIVDEAAPGAILLRVAVTDIRAQQKPRKFWQYTPVGLIKGRVDAAKGANVALHSATIEIELVDALTGQALASVVETDDYESWRDVVGRLDWWVRHIVDDPRRWV
jgi:hypothetical protein